MDKIPIDSSDESFDLFIASEKERGTNFVTIVGGEPALVPDRIRKIHQNFKTNVATNGLIKIPREGMESMPIGIAIWGDHETDSKLRGEGLRDYFTQAMDNYRGDDRAFWYYTVAPGCADEIESVVEQCVANGNPVLFNYYSDVEKLGGTLDYRQGFDHVRKEIDRMTARFPERIYTTPYFNKVVTTGSLYNESWGYKVCTNLSANSPVNTIRLQNGKPYNPHFRAYNADFVTTRRCCTGITRDCASCFDTWEHFSWIMINMKKHLSTKMEFANWLTTMYIFYLVNRLVDYDRGMLNLVKIQQMQLSISPGLQRVGTT